MTWLAAIALGVLAVNLVAFLHARALLSFSGRGVKTQNPEQLTVMQKLAVLVTGVRIPKPQDEHTPNDVGLAFERHVIEVDARVRLGAWQVPHPQPRAGIILFHGFTASKGQLLSEAVAFHARGYSVLMVDFRGSGESSESYTSVGYDEAIDVQAAVRYATIELGVNSPVLYGRSMGACAVLRAAAQGSLASVSAIVLEGVFDTMLNTVKQRFMSMGVPHTPLAQLLVLWGGVQHGFWAFAHNPVDYAPRCKVPVLMLHGSEDQRATLAQARTVFDGLVGPKTIAVFEGAEHEPLIAFDRARWDAAIDAFLSR